MQQLTIVRDKWLRGTAHSMLRTPEGLMCCLGFYAKACGMTDEQITNASMPSSLVEKVGKANVPSALLVMTVKTGLRSDGTRRYGDTIPCQQLAAHNDAIHVEDTYRETHITQIFRDDLGVEVTFV